MADGIKLIRTVQRPINLKIPLSSQSGLSVEHLSHTNPEIRSSSPGYLED